MNVSECFPDCWDDDERMNYLFSPFRESRELNPKDWDTKLKFWSDCIQRFCRYNKTAVFHSPDLANSFKRKEATPQGIETVLKDLSRNSRILRKEDFETGAGDSWSAWGRNVFVSRPSRWMFNAVIRGRDAFPPGVYVDMTILKEFADEAINRHYIIDGNNHIQDLQGFRKELENICDEESCDLVLMYLQKMKKVCLEKLAEGTVLVKFSSKKTSNVEAVTEAEIGMYRVKKTIESLTKQLEQLALEVQQHHDQAKQNIRNGLKTTAKNCLRKKKLTQQRLEKRENARETLQMILEKIESAESDKMVIDAYKAGSSALKSTMKQGPSLEQVDETMSDVQEVLEMCNEINDTWIQGNKDLDDTINFGADVDLDALESELASLGDETITAPASSSFLDNLPSIPDAELPQVSTEDAITEQQKNIHQKTKQLAS